MDEILQYNAGKERMEGMQRAVLWKRGRKDSLILCLRGQMV